MMPILKSTRLRSLCWLFAPMFLLIAEIHAEERTVLASIADILSRFQHKCTPAQCETLRAIVEADTASVPERTLAAVLLGVDHVPHPKHMSVLQRLASDPAQPADVRTIAEMLRRFVHLPTGRDRVMLDAMMSSKPDDDR